MKNILLSFYIIGLTGCISSKKMVLTYVDHYKIPSNVLIKNTVFGGISGIDYDAKRNVYYLISDDRSENAPARFYEAKIEIKRDKIDTIKIDSVILLLDGGGNEYKKETVDLESIRFNPRKKQFILGDEGGNLGKANIKIINNKGRYVKDLNINASYLASTRNNKSFESLSLSKDFRSLFYATEAPLVTDGNEASPENKGLLRIIECKFDTGKKLKEWKYWLEKTPQNSQTRPDFRGSKSDNGLSEILHLNKDQFLLLERSGASLKDGSFNFISKIYQGFPKKDNMQKKMIFDFSKLTFGDANVEGMTFIETLDNQKYLLLVSDNNFLKDTPTLVYLLKISYE